MEIRWSYDRLISTMGFPILVRCHLYIESGPWFIISLDNDLVPSVSPPCLTHWCQDRMATILQRTSSNLFPVSKLLYCNSNFTKSSSQRSNQQYTSIGLDNGLAPNRRQAIIWTNDGLVYRCICITLSPCLMSGWSHHSGYTWVNLRFIPSFRVPHTFHLCSP